MWTCGRCGFSGPGGCGYSGLGGCGCAGLGGCGCNGPGGCGYIVLGGAVYLVGVVAVDLVGVAKVHWLIKWHNKMVKYRKKGAMARMICTCRISQVTLVLYSTMYI